MNTCRLDHEHKHGGSHCYDTGKCRCDRCRQGNSEREKHRRRMKAYGRWEGRVPARGSQRRIQALQFLGFTLDQIGDVTGIPRNTVWRVLRNEWVETPTRDRINQAYTVLLRDPTAGASERTARQAKRKGYVSPLSWDDIDADEAPVTARERVRTIDHVAVDLTMTGQRVHLTRDDKLEAVRRMTSSGWGRWRICETLRINTVTLDQMLKEVA